MHVRIYYLRIDKKVNNKGKTNFYEKLLKLI